MIKSELLSKNAPQFNFSRYQSDNDHQQTVQCSTIAFALLENKIPPWLQSRSIWAKTQAIWLALGKCSRVYAGLFS